MTNILRFLVVDDEEPIVVALKTLIQKAYPNAVVTTATDGLEAWNGVQKLHPNIVIADVNMPGIDGFELCKRIRADKSYNNVFFITLTADSDRELRLKMLEVGSDEFLTKPFSTDELVSRLKSACRFVNLQMQLKEENDLLQALADELEASLQDMKLLTLNMIQARMPNATTLLQNVAEASVWIARELNQFSEDEIKDIEIAALMVYSGKLFLPDNLINRPVMINGKPTDKLMFQVPVLSKNIAASTHRYKDVADILYHIYENLDGSGFPERQQAWQIPMASRIIRVVLDFEETKYVFNKGVKEAYDVIAREVKRLYDHRVVVFLDQFIAFKGMEGKNISEKIVQLQDLQEGMKLSRDVISTAGLKLMPAGAILTEKLIHRIFSHNASDPILGNIYIES